MEDAVMLFDGQVVPLSAVSDTKTFNSNNPNLLFFDNYIEKDPDNTPIDRVGRVRRFKKGNIAYMAIFDSKTGLFIGYYSEKKFWENNYAENNIKGTVANYKFELGDKFSYIPFFPYENEMKVYFGYKFININDNQEINLVVNYQYALYDEISKNSNLQNLLVHSNGDNSLQAISTPVSDELNYYGNYIIFKEYLLPNGTLSSLTTDQKEVLFEIIYVWNEIISDTNFKEFLIENELYNPFEAHINLPNRYNLPYGSIDINYHKLYDEEYFGRLRLGLIEFRYWTLNYKDEYSKININELAVYIVNLFPAEELSYLQYDLKINLLDKILKGSNWIIGDWYFNSLNEEQALIKLIRSIPHEDNGNLNYEDIDKFLLFLNTLYDYSENKTLYEVLYSKINDGIVYDDDGNGNKGQFVKAVYLMWTFSKYNPYHENTTVANNALSNFSYTPYNSLWQSYDPSINFSTPDDTASPMVINYESDKVLLWYIDNFKFEFYKNKIVAKEDLPNYGYQPYGVYNFFQPVALKGASANDTVIKMPVLNMPLGTSNPNDYIKNCIPAFYLMYVDEVGDRSDAKETIGTAIDVVLTFSGVGGAVANLRHLKDLSLVRKLAIGLTLAEKELFLRGLAGLASISEAFFSAASFFHNLATTSCTVYYNSSTTPDTSSPEYLEYKRCQSIDKWLFALEIVSLSGDLLARRQLRRVSRELAENLADDIPVEHRQVIDDLADLDGLLNDFLNSIQSTHPNVHSKLIAFTDEEKKFAFMFDFEKDITSLNKLNANPALVDKWDEIEHLLIQRKNIKFLESYNLIKNETEVLDHIHIGGFEIKLRGGNSVIGEPKITGSHNQIVLRSPPPPPLLSGEMSFVTTPAPSDYSNPSDIMNSYVQGKIQRNMNDLIDPMTNQHFVNGSGSSIAVKKVKNVYFPKSYSTERINEEIAFVHSQIDLATPFNVNVASNGSHSFFYRGVATDGHTIEIIYLSPTSNINTKTLQTIYPLNF